MRLSLTAFWVSCCLPKERYIKGLLLILRLTYLLCPRCIWRVSLDSVRMDWTPYDMSQSTLMLTRIKALKYRVTGIISVYVIEFSAWFPVYACYAFACQVVKSARKAKEIYFASIRNSRWETVVWVMDRTELAAYSASLELDLLAKKADSAL